MRLSFICLGLMHSHLASYLGESIYVRFPSPINKLNGRGRSRASHTLFGSALVSLRWGKVQRLLTAASCTLSMKELKYFLNS